MKTATSRLVTCHSFCMDIHNTSKQDIGCSFAVFVMSIGHYMVYKFVVWCVPFTIDHSPVGANPSQTGLASLCIPSSSALLIVTICR